MTGILKVDQWKDSGDNTLMTSDGAGNLTVNAPRRFSSTGIDDNATSTAITIDSSGNVGIGTLSANSRLHLKGAAYTALTVDGTAGGQLDFYRNGLRHAQIFTDNAGGDIIFRNNPNSERMRINSSGNVGIGTSSPSSKLEVNGTITIGTGTGTYQAGVLGFTDTNFGFGYRPPRAGAIAAHSFQTFNGTRILEITESGNVGIGTSIPFGPLHLYGGTGGPSTSGNMADVGFIVSSSTGGRAIQLGTNSTDSFNFIQSAYVNNTNVANDLAFFIGATQRMRINSSGVTITGSISKSSGSFQIPHPLPEKTNTHNLVHSFIEAPQADNIYRGKVDLVNGTATVNIDTVAGMSEGTFILLNREVQCFTSNETGWTAVKGSVSENILTITAQDETCTDTISWLVIGERQDQHMYDTEWTDENGKVIVEPLKPVEEETLENA
jgi:hypothetical protein